jgi:hypothetical protein
VGRVEIGALYASGGSSSTARTLGAEIPTLAAALDPGELGRHLDTLGWDTSHGMRVRVLEWKPASRCTFEISLPDAHGGEGRELIGKVYAEDRSDVYRTRV